MGYAATSTTCLKPHPPTCAGRCGARVPAGCHRGSPRHECLYKRLKSSKPNGEDLSLSDWPRGILDDHVTSLARSGVTILLVEQRAHQAMQIADWCYVLVAGRVELNDAPAALLARPDFGELFLGRSARSQPRRARTCPRPLPARQSPPPARTRPGR